MDRDRLNLRSFVFGRLAVTLPAIFVVVVWELAVAVIGNTFFTGSPQGVALRAYDQVIHGKLIKDCLVTGREAGLGLLIGVFSGGAVGMSLALNLFVRRMAAPYIDALAVIPPIAFGPLAVLALGTGDEMKVGFAALSAALVMLGYAFVGGMSLDERILETLRVIPHRRWRKWLLVIMPAFSTWLVGGLRAALAAALVGAFVGEIISSSRGLGYHIQHALGLFDIDDVWVGILGFCLVGVTLSMTVQVLAEAALRTIRHHVPLDGRRSWASKWFSRLESALRMR